jgi:hypothetical protein
MSSVVGDKQRSSTRIRIVCKRGRRFFLLKTRECTELLLDRDLDSGKLPRTPANGMLVGQVHAPEALMVLVGIGEHIGGMQALISFLQPT